MNTPTPNSWVAAFEGMLDRAPLQHTPTNITLIVLDLPEGATVVQDLADTVVVPPWAYTFCMKSLKETYHLRLLKEQPYEWVVGLDGTKCLYHAVTFEARPRTNSPQFQVQ